MHSRSSHGHRATVRVGVFLSLVSVLLGGCPGQPSGTDEPPNEPNEGGEAPPCPSVPADGFLENFSGQSSSLFRVSGVPDRVVRFRQDSGEACDGKLALLRYPAGFHGAGTGNATAIETRERLHFGAYRARMRVPRGNPGETVVTGFFTFANDRQDADGDGLFDNSEIDFEFVSGQPELIYITIWTDAGDPAHPGDLGDFINGPGGKQPNYQRVSRVINMRTGRIRESKQRIGEYEDVPEPLSRTIPDFDPSERFYEYQFVWKADEVRFSIIDEAGEIVLWQLTEADRIPTQPAQLIFNVWYSDDWNGKSAPNDPPSENADLWVDWAMYAPPAGALLYESDFSSDPSWVTDQPNDYFWDPSTDAFHATTRNAMPGPPPTRFAYTLVNYTGGSFLLEFDIKPLDIQWSSAVMFGLYDSSLAVVPWDSAPDAHNINVEFGSADPGIGITLRVAGLSGGVHYDQVYNTYEVGRWYHCRLEYDAGSQVASFLATDRDTGVVVASLTVSGFGGLPPTLNYLGFARDPNGWNCPGAPGYSCSARSTALIDNVRLRETSVEP